MQELSALKAKWEQPPAQLPIERLTPGRAAAFVKQFALKIWNHPFVDNKTTLFRQSGLKAMNQALANTRLNPSVLAILVGSTAFGIISPDTSDIDFIAVGTQPQVDTLNDHILHSQDPEINRLSLIPADPWTGRVNIGSSTDESIGLLYTPDRFLAGNLDIAYQMRAATLDFSRNGLGAVADPVAEFEEYWRSQVAEYVLWPLSLEDPHQPQRRYSRFSLQPEQKVKRYLQHVQLLTLPSYRHLQLAFSHTNNKLSI